MLNNVYILLTIAIMISLFSSKLMKLVHFPNVTGYLISGLLIGPYCLKLLPLNFVESLNPLAEIALGFIALSIGAEFKLSFLKEVGKTPIIIAILEGLMAVIVVDTVLIASGFDVAFSLCLGAIASATAPAATLMIIKQYNAKGPVTKTLLPVVALDDAVALIAFGLSTAIAKSISSPEQTSILLSLIKPISEIFLSLLIGSLLGVIYAYLTKLFTGRGNRLSITIAMIFLANGLSTYLNLSSLLTIMMMSAVYINISPVYEQIFNITDRLTPPLFMLFFFFSGAELNISIIAKVGLIGIIYLICRVIGKVIGAAIGCKICKTEPTVTKYLGWTLIPQAGVAIGLATTAMTVVPEHGAMIRTVVLCSTVIYELIGPLVTKTALIKAKEIN